MCEISEIDKIWAKNKRIQTVFLLQVNMSTGILADIYTVTK